MAKNALCRIKMGFLRVNDQSFLVLIIREAGFVLPTVNATFASEFLKVKRLIINPKTWQILVK